MKAFGQIGKSALIVAAVAALVAVVSAIAGAKVVLLVALILVVTFGVLGSVFTIVQRRMFGSAAQLRRIEQAGVPGFGVIAEVGPTVGRVGANPIMRLTLTIGVGQSIIRTIVPVQHLGLLTVGSKLPVLIDPDDSDRAIIDWPRVAR